MSKATKILTVAAEPAMNNTYRIRGQQLMTGKDLVELYGVTTNNMNLAVNRCKKRFPGDCMSQLTWRNLKF